VGLGAVDGVLPVARPEVDNLFQMGLVTCIDYVDLMLYEPDTSEYDSGLIDVRTLHDQFYSVLTIREVCGRVERNRSTFLQFCFICS
jgi:hypothetical protein